MKFTIMGCGASLGTPAPGGFWGNCDPKEPKNERTRTAILAQSENTNLLIDAGFDLRLQLNRLELKRIDAVLVTHAHADHINGISDLRIFSYHQKELVNFYTNEETFKELDLSCPYAFKPQCEGVYQPFLKKNLIASNYEDILIGDINIKTYEQDHYSCNSLGLRFDNFAYSVDVADLNEQSLKVLEGVETWVVGCAGYHSDDVRTHANLKKVMEWVDLLKPKMTYLTVLTTRMDYKTLCEELPPHIRPCYDGMVIDMDGNMR